MRKEKANKDDNSESDMDMSDDEENDQKRQIETNVPIPAMMPRSIRFFWPFLCILEKIKFF